MRPRWVPKIGGNVQTSPFGLATVTRVMGRNLLVRLLEMGGLEVELPVEQLTPLDGDSQVAQAPTAIPAKETPGPPTPEPAAMLVSAWDASAPLAGDAGARKSVEALRFGLVPTDGLERLTLGFDELRDWVLGRLPAARHGHPQVSAVTGPFGAGKSHTMAVIRHVARAEGYVTARVEVDGINISLSNPQRLLHQLWMTTEASDFRSSTPVLDLYLKAIAAGRSSPSIAPRGIDRIKHNYEVVSALHRAGEIDQHGDLLEALLSSSEEVTAKQVADAIKHGSRAALGHFAPKAMIGRTVEDRPYDFVEILAGHAIVAMQAGYRGLVVTIDEFEVEQRLTAKQYERVADLLEVVRSYLQGELDHSPAPLGLFFATVGQEEHEGDAFVNTMLGSDESTGYELRPWSPDQLAALAQRILDLYGAAYGLEIGFEPVLAENVGEQLEREGYGDSGLIRAFIKRFVGALDARYGPPGSGWMT